MTRASGHSPRGSRSRPFRPIQRHRRCRPIRRRGRERPALSALLRCRAGSGDRSRQSGTISADRSGHRAPRRGPGDRGRGRHVLGGGEGRRADGAGGAARRGGRHAGSRVVLLLRAGTHGAPGRQPRHRPESGPAAARVLATLGALPGSASAARASDGRRRVHDPVRPPAAAHGSGPGRDLRGAWATGGAAERPRTRARGAAAHRRRAAAEPEHAARDIYRARARRARQRAECWRRSSASTTRGSRTASARSGVSGARGTCGATTCRPTCRSRRCSISPS